MNRVTRGFVVVTSKGVLRLLGVPKEVTTKVETKTPLKRKIVDKSAKPVAIAGATGALIYASSDERLRAAMKQTLKRGVDAYKRERRAQQRARASARSATQPRDGSTNGSGLSSMSREELYKLAQQKDIPGRSSMNKEELKKALS